MEKYTLISNIAYDYTGWREYFLNIHSKLLPTFLKFLNYIIWLNNELEKVNYLVDISSQAPIVKLLYGGVESLEPLILPEDTDRGLSLAGLHRDIFSIKQYSSGKVEVKNLDIREIQELIKCISTCMSLIQNKGIVTVESQLNTKDIISEVNNEIEEWFKSNKDNPPPLKYLYNFLDLAIQFLPWFNPYSFLVMGLRISARTSLRYLGLEFNDLFRHKINNLSLSEILDIEKLSESLAVYKGLSSFRWSEKCGLGLTIYLILGNIIGFIILNSNKLTKYLIGFDDVVKGIRRFPNTTIVNSKNMEDFIRSEVKDRDLLESIEKLISGFKGLDPNSGLRLVGTKYIERMPSTILMLIHFNLGNYFGNPIKLTYNPSYRTYVREFIGYSLIPYWNPSKWPDLTINHGEFLNKIKEVF